MKPIGISQARARLFGLVDKVLETDQIVWIEHRDRDSRVALVSEQRLKHLEETSKVRCGRSKTGFKLAGSVRLGPGETDSDRIIDELRREAAGRAAAKFDEG